VMNYFGSIENVKLVVLPRNHKQELEINRKWAPLIERGVVVIPNHAVDGLNLIWHSDFVVSGGGTMNREAAALNVPVYSIFRGEIGAVDRYLAENGRLILIRTIEEFRARMSPVKRPIPQKANFAGRPALKQIVSAIKEIVERSSNH